MTCSKADPDMPEVPEVRVCVESVFEEGLVVCYTDPAGLEYRGALLAPTPTDQRLLSVVKPTSRELANPLSYVHDHPYCNLNRYAKHVSSKIPSEILLNWSTLPSLLADSKTNNLEEIGKRRKLAEVPLLSENDDMQLSMPQIRSSTVFTDPIKEPRRRHRIYCPSVTGRTAKKIAISKIFGVDNSLGDSESSHLYAESHKRSHKKRKSIKSKVKKRQHQSRSHSPCVVDSPRPKPNISLKNFSIPLCRIRLSPIGSPCPPSTICTPSPSPPESSCCSSPCDVIVVD